MASVYFGFRLGRKRITSRPIAERYRIAAKYLRSSGLADAADGRAVGYYTIEPFLTRVRELSLGLSRARSLAPRGKRLFEE